MLNFSRIRQQFFQLMLRVPSPIDYVEPIVQWWLPTFNARLTHATVVKHHIEAGCVRIRLRLGRWNRQPFLPGQHVTLHIQHAGRWLQRPFSLCSSLDDFYQRREVELAIKVNAKGQFTGRLLSWLRHDAMLYLSPPAGQFTYQMHKPAVMITGGSGITPLFSMLSSASRFPQPVDLLYCYRGPQRPLFYEELTEIAAKARNVRLHFHDSQSGRVNIAEWLSARRIAHQTQFYLSGPTSLLTSTQAALQQLGVVNAHVHVEQFGVPMAVNEGGTAPSLQIKLGARMVEVEAQGTLLHSVEQAGLAVQSGCRRGICMQCLCQKNFGVVKNLLTGELSDNGPAPIQLCISQAVSATELQLPGGFNG